MLFITLCVITIRIILIIANNDKNNIVNSSFITWLYVIVHFVLCRKVAWNKCVPFSRMYFGFIKEKSWYLITKWRIYKYVHRNYLPRLHHMYTAFVQYFGYSSLLLGYCFRGCIHCPYVVISFPLLVNVLKYFPIVFTSHEVSFPFWSILIQLFWTCDLNVCTHTCNIVLKFL